MKLFSMSVFVPPKYMYSNVKIHHPLFKIDAVSTNSKHKTVFMSDTLVNLI